MSGLNGVHYKEDWIHLIKRRHLRSRTRDPSEQTHQLKYL